MKNTNFLITGCLFFAVTIITSCNSPAEKVENAQDKVTEANGDLKTANEEYLKDVENYKAEVKQKVETNERNIAELKEQLKNEKKEAKADYEKKVAELEVKNRNMEDKMNDYKESGKEKWEVFKKEFSHDMDELGSAFKDLTVKNVK